MSRSFIHAHALQLVTECGEADIQFFISVRNIDKFVYRECPVIFNKNQADAEVAPVFFFHWNANKFQVGAAFDNFGGNFCCASDDQLVEAPNDFFEFFLALRGIPYKPMSASKLLRNNLWIYGVGGIIAPFIGIKLIDMILVALHLV